MRNRLRSLLSSLQERPEGLVLALSVLLALFLLLRPTWSWSERTTDPAHYYTTYLYTDHVERAWIWASPYKDAHYDSKQVVDSLAWCALLTGGLLVGIGLKHTNRKAAREWRRLWSTTQEAQCSSLLRASQPPSSAQDTLVRPASYSQETDTTTLLRISTEPDC